VKSTEPVFSAIIGTVFYGKKVSTPKWLCLIPIIGGVAITVLKPKYEGAKIHEFTAGEFSVISLLGGMAANCFAAFKGSEVHKIMEEKGGIKDRIGGPVNQFAVMTIVSLLVSIPLVWVYPIVYGLDVNQNLSVFYETITGQDKSLLIGVVASGLAFYLYNEFATLSLKKLSPVTSSVANTFKRVFVIVAGVIMYEDERKKATIYTVIGCIICMFGVGLYSCIDDLMKKKPKTA
jgi:solute carrier family 35 protein E1